MRRANLEKVRSALKPKEGRPLRAKRLEAFPVAQIQRHDVGQGC